ncbi:hypothetical protein D3C87_1696450 [compost metagenome]
MGGERFRTAKADREFEYRESVEEFERSCLPARNVKREGRSRTGALICKHLANRGRRIVKRQIMDFLDLGMRLQEFGHHLGIAVCPLHADL